MAAILVVGVVGLVTGLTIHPNTHFYGNRLDVTFLESTDFSYLAVGDQYVVFDGLNLSVSGINNIMMLNISHIDSDLGNRNTGTTMLQFNATYSGSTATFTFDGNHTNARYNVYVDDVAQTHTDNANQVAFTISAWSDHDIEIELEGYVPDTPYAGASDYDNDTNYCNLTWTQGNYSDYDVVVGNSGHYPTSPTDGTVWQNETFQYYNFSVNTTQYFTVWSYNDTTDTYSSTGLNIPWGVVRINVFNASKTWEQVTPFGLIIQNQDGTDIYLNSSVTPPLYLDVDDIPFGTDTVFVINASGYKQQRYTRDTLVNHFHNYTFLLPPVDTSTPGEGDPDDEGEPTNETDSLLYLISVIDELSNPVPDVLVQFKLYVNSTDTYEEVGSFLSDGNGQGTIYLVPNKLHQVIVSKDQYKTGTSYWTPSRELLVKTFMIEFEDEEPEQPDIPLEEIRFTLERAGTTLFINYTDAMGETINTTVYVWGEDQYGTQTLLHTDIRTGESSFAFTVTSVNSSHSFKAILYYNHTTFGEQSAIVVIHGDWETPDQGSAFNDLVNALVGSHPWGWANFMIFMFILAAFHQADNRDAGKWLILIGGLFLFLNVVLGWNSTLFTVAGGVIPVLFIAIGVLQMWKDNRRVSE